MNIRIAAAALVALLCAPFAFAQPLTLDEAVERALATEPTVAAATADLEAAQAGKREAGSALNPQLSLSGSVMQYDEPMLVSPIHGFLPSLIPDFETTLIQSALSGTWLLWDGGGARSRVRQAEALAGVAGEGVAQARQALIARTATSYLSVIAGAESLAAEDVRLRAIDAEMKRVGLLKEVGRAADLEIYRAEAAKAAAEAERTAAAAQLEVAEADLSRLTSLPLERTRAANLEGSMSAVAAPEDAAAAEVAAIENNPRVRQARQRVLAQQAAVETAKAGRHPQVNLAGNVLEYGADTGEFIFEWNAGVNFRFSVFDSGATSARIERAMAGERFAKAQAMAVENEVRQSLDRVFAELRQAGATVQSLEMAERRFGEVARIEKLRLDNGAGTQTDYLRAEADLAGSRASLARARQRLASARVELARVSGSLDTEWIASNLRSTR